MHNLYIQVHIKKQLDIHTQFYQEITNGKPFFEINQQYNLNYIWKREFLLLLVRLQVHSEILD